MCEYKTFCISIIIIISFLLSCFYVALHSCVTSRKCNSAPKLFFFDIIDNYLKFAPKIFHIYSRLALKLYCICPSAENRPVISISRHDVTPTPRAICVLGAAGVQSYQVARRCFQMIYSLVRNSATSGAACPLSAGQWGKRPRHAESVGLSKSSSALRN